MCWSYPPCSDDGNPTQSKAVAPFGGLMGCAVHARVGSLGARGRMREAKPAEVCTEGGLKVGGRRPGSKSGAPQDAARIGLAELGFDRESTPRALFDATE